MTSGSTPLTLLKSGFLRSEASRRILTPSETFEDLEFFTSPAFLHSPGISTNERGPSVVGPAPDLLGDDFRKWYPRNMNGAPSLDEVRLRQVFRALQEYSVEYAVFGAVALGLHGLARATGDLDLFIQPAPDNVERLKTALRSVFDDPSIDEIRSEDLCGDYPAVRYLPPEGFGFDLVTRLGESVRYSDLEVELKTYDEVSVRVVTPRTLWRLKKDTARPLDRLDAAMLAERFGLEKK